MYFIELEPLNNVGNNVFYWAEIIPKYLSRIGLITKGAGQPQQFTVETATSLFALVPQESLGSPFAWRARVKALHFFYREPATTISA
ncbi:MAG TPA: hypothetical protein DCR03_00965 [Gammaproteobacteria bacterium]|nr:hypothetical protein [Gammaproteobacteria bacterium]